MGNRKRAKQISVTFEDEFYERLLRACEIQEHAAAQLARILVEWALPFYEAEKSVEKLKQQVPRNLGLEVLEMALDVAARQQREKDLVHT